METFNCEKPALAGKYLTLVLGSERYGVEILKVQEIIRIPEITRVPRCPDFVMGVVNLRGNIIPVVELRRKLGLDSIKYDEKACIVVLKLQSGEHSISAGIMVDTVVEVIDLQSSEIESTPDGMNGDTSYLLGIGKRSNCPLCLLIDIDRLLSPEEFKRLSKNSQLH